MVNYHKQLLQAMLLLQLHLCQEGIGLDHLAGGLETYILQQGHTLLYNRTLCRLQSRIRTDTAFLQADHHKFPTFYRKETGRNVILRYVYIET